MNKTIILLFTLALPALLTACSNSYERGNALVAADEMMEGPGIFSGEKGGFYLVGGGEKVTPSKPVSKMDLNETSKLLDTRIEQLKKDQIELEALKRDLNKKLEQ